jgi:hypothetical protein
MSFTMYAIGQRSPIRMTEGLFIQGPPLMIMIGIPRPTLSEINVINHGRVLHKFGLNEHTAWLTMHFYDEHDTLGFQGELFFSAGQQPENFTEEKLAALRADLSGEIGLLCPIVLVDTVDQRIATVRGCSWSHTLSLAFLDAAEKTRNVSPEAATRAAYQLMKHTNDDLAKMADVMFNLAGDTPH